MKTALYRHWDIDGVLLYVGISLSAVARLVQHKKSHWSGRIASVTIQQYPDRPSAERAERSAIRSEKPLYNIAHVPAANDNTPEPAVVPSNDYEPLHTVTVLPPAPEGDEYVRGSMQAHILIGSDLRLPRPDYRRVHASGKFTGNYWLLSRLESVCAEHGRKPYQWFDEQQALYLASCTSRAA